jgi:hypothetical protein
MFFLFIWASLSLSLIYLFHSNLLVQNAIWSAFNILLIVYPLSSRSLKNHKLSGPISPDLGKLAHLKILYVFSGIFYFYWKLSVVFCIKGMVLFFLYVLIWMMCCRALYNNSFYGTIPSELGNCTELQGM